MLLPFRLSIEEERHHQCEQQAQRGSEHNAIPNADSRTPK